MMDGSSPVRASHQRGDRDPRRIDSRARQPSYLSSKILARRPAYPPADTSARRVNLPWIAEAEDEQSLGGIKLGGERRASVAHIVPDEALTRRPPSAKSLLGYVIREHF
jgi:hypothetical protein